MGWIMPEEDVFAAVASGRQMILDAIAGNTLAELVGRIFANSDRQADIMQWFSEHRIELVHGWPRSQQTLPCWGVVLLAGENSVQYEGDAGDDGGDGTGLGDSAERWSNAIGVVSRDENSDVVRWIHQLAKWSLSRARVDLAARFPYRQQSSEQDLKPEDLQGEQGGRTIFSRLLRFQCEYDQTDVGALADQTEITDVIPPEVIDAFADTEA